MALRTKETRQDRQEQQGGAAGNLDLRDTAGDRGETGGEERGRQAEAPQEIPPAGWTDVAKRVKAEAKADNLSLVSGGVAFFGLLSLAPALAAAVSIFGLVATPEDVARRIENMADVLPEDARGVLRDQLDQVVTTTGARLGFAAVIGVALALWSASTAMKHLITALDSMYDEEEGRGFVKLRSRAALLTIGGLVFMGAAIAALTVAPGWVDALGIGALSTAVSILRWPVLAVMMAVGLSVMYRYAPDRDQPKFRWVSWGAGIATVIWIVASVAFSLYTSSFGSYNKTYGTMAAVAIMMLWLYLTAACVLLGAEINAELEHQTARDSTKGPTQPLGGRGAEAADTVAGSADS